MPVGGVGRVGGLTVFGALAADTRLLDGLPPPRTSRMKNNRAEQQRTDFARLSLAGSGLSQPAS